MEENPIRTAAPAFFSRVLLTLEHTPKEKHGSYSAMPQLGSPVGTLLSSGAFAMVGMAVGGFLGGYLYDVSNIRPWVVVTVPALVLCARMLGWSRESATTSLVTGPVLIPFGRLQVFPSLPPPRLSLGLCSTSGGHDDPP